MRLYGFTLLRNAIRYDYPYQESLKSLGGIVELTVVALGKSDDGTEAAVAALPAVVSIPTVWDENLRKSGLILSEQTNLALDSLRERVQKDLGNLEGAWGFYLQADEVISDLEYDLILKDIQEADSKGYDAVRFRYLHFWKSHYRIAVAKRWYPQEIRAIRLKSDAKSYGDAQSFRLSGRIYESDAHIFHYGHVREESAYENKKRDFHRWWHSDSEMVEIAKKAVKADQLEPTLAYFGPHPSAMIERMKRLEKIDLKNPEMIALVGDPKLFPPEFAAGVQAKKLLWAASLSELSSSDRKRAVVLKGAKFWDRLCYRTRVPEGMGSPQARPWRPEFRAILQLSEKNVAWYPRSSVHR